MGWACGDCQLLQPFLGLIPAFVAVCAAPYSRVSCQAQLCRGSCPCPSVPVGLGWLQRAGGCQKIIFFQVTCIQKILWVVDEC